MIDIILYCTVSAVTPLVTYIMFQKRKGIAKFTKNLFVINNELPKITIIPDVIDTPDLVVVENTEPMKFETAEQKLHRLSWIHKKASNEYDNYHSSHMLLEETDRYLQSVLGKHEDKGGKIKIGDYTSVIGGVEIWTGSKYHGFGNIYSGPYAFSTSECRISKLTFLWLVDVLEKEQSPIVWKQKHANYENRKNIHFMNG